MGQVDFDSAMNINQPITKISPLQESDVLLIKCSKHFNNANVNSCLGTATTFHDDFVTVNKAQFTLQLSHITSNL